LLSSHEGRSQGCTKPIPIQLAGSTVTSATKPAGAQALKAAGLSDSQKKYRFGREAALCMESSGERRDTAWAVSQENVQSFRRATEAYNRRDVDALLNELDPEVEWHSALLIPFGGEATVTRGHDGVRELLGEVQEDLAEIHLDYSDIRDLGDRIVGIGRIRTQGKHSGAETEMAFGTVTDMKNGKGIRIWTYLDPQEALEAAGLSE
jgi:ketosteroid isomerase-like protein